MAIQKVALLNAQEFEVEYSYFNTVDYMITITEIDPTDVKEPPKQISLISSEYADLVYVF